jgi:AcrR family transcriptional regulator
MGSRKVRPKKPPPLPPSAKAAGGSDDAARTDEAAFLDAATTDEHDLRPSASMTREMEAATSADLVAGSIPTGSISAVPVAPPTTRVLDDLAQTLEGPAAPRILILDAAESVLAEVGFQALNEAEVARRAGLPLEVLRAHFANKRALLHAMNDRFCAQSIAVTNDATHSGIWDHASGRDVIEVTVKSILDVVLSRAALVRAVLSSEDQELLDGFRRIGSTITERVTRVMKETRDAPEDRPAPRDVAFALLLAVSLGHHAIMVGTEWSGVEFDRDELYDRATKAAVAYIAARPRPS